MKKIFSLAAIACMIMASCTNDSLVDDFSQNKYDVSKVNIGFNMTTANSTRADALQTKGHYEFGVFGYSGAEADVNGDQIMENYLVAYGSLTNPYKDLAAGASTWMAGAEASTTVPGDGVSSWFYEGLDNASNYKAPVIPDVAQSLKYWDESTAATYFSAYAPYYNQVAVKTANDKAVEYTESATKGAETLKFQNLSTFYTDPVQQIATATAPYTGEGAYDTNTELINANEALYAYTNVNKSSYGNDVSILFNHVNSQIKIAFYEAIKGYKVELIDLLPEANAWGETYQGIQLTPAKPAQTNWLHDGVSGALVGDYYPQPANGEKPAYYDQADVTVKGIKDVDSIKVAAPANGALPVVDNFIYAPANDATALIKSATKSKTVNCISELKDNPTKLATVLYALPRYQGATNITGGVGVETGFTLHVSYKLIPEDGSKETTIYDARVYVDPMFCKWEAGTCYTYVFKITSNTNGTTDPDKVDPASSSTNPTDSINPNPNPGPTPPDPGKDPNDPYVDPDDPRVPDDPALKPIVFDGIEVVDYVTGETGKINPTDEWTISNPSFWPMSGGLYKSRGMVNAADIAEVVTPGFEIVDPTTGVVTVDATGRKFTWTYSATSSVFEDIAATKQGSVSVAYTDAIMDVSGLTTAQQDKLATMSGSATIPTYTIFIWKSTTANVSYTAVPVKVVVSCTETPVLKKDATGHYLDAGGNTVTDPALAAVDHIDYEFNFAPQYLNTTGITSAAASASQAYAIAKPAATHM